MKKNLLLAAAFIVAATGAAQAEEATLGSCLAAVQIAKLHDNLWQSDLSMEECARIAGKAIDDGMEALKKSADDTTKSKCEEDQFESKGKCYDSLADIPGRTRVQTRKPR
jgi:hypothetical protein